MPYDELSSGGIEDDADDSIELSLPQQRHQQHQLHQEHHHRQRHQQSLQATAIGERKQSPMLNTMMRERRAANIFNENYVTDAQNNGK